MQCFRTCVAVYLVCVLVGCLTIVLFGIIVLVFV